MATAVCFAHCLLLFLYFGVRYVVDVIFRPLGLVVLEKDNDATAYHYIEFLVTLAKGCQRVYSALLPPRVLVVLAHIGIVLPTTRNAIQSICCSRMVNATTAFVLKSIARNVNDRKLWSALSAFITFTRISSGREPRPEERSLSKRYSLNLKFVPLLIRAGIIYFAVRCLSSSLLFYIPSLNSSGTAATSGFSATIPGCYDGDTCHSENLKFDGKTLPDLFASLNIRVLGIDSPEIRSAKCDLERCLAERAKYEINRIVKAGSGMPVSLVDCRHDKYGGRITCDLVIEGRSAADEMLDTGLAVPYHGKRKNHSWCDDFMSLTEYDPLYRHVLACGGWEGMDDDMSWAQGIQ